MRPDGFVLAGGRGRRLGLDKARLAHPGSWPMAVHVATRLAEVAGAVALVRRGEPDGLPWSWPDGRPIPVVREPADGEPHPLWGVGFALRSARTQVALLAPCDLPELPAEAFARLLAAGAPAIATSEGRDHPLVALLPVGLADRALELAARGAPVRRFAEGFARVAVPTSWTRNVNTWSETGRANPLEELVQRLGVVGEAAERVRQGERRRLGARGALLP